MPTDKEAMNIFLNSLWNSVEDIRQIDADGYDAGFRASQSYWINNTKLHDRWRDYRLPQIQVFVVGGRTIAEGKHSESERYEQKLFQTDVYASGWDQKGKLSAQVRSIMRYKERNSTNASGLKLDKIVQDFDGIDDERVPQEIWRRIITFRVIYKATGA